MKEKTKAKISVPISAMGMMSFLVPAAVIANMVQAFPDKSASMIQMVITIPALISIPMGMVAAKLAKRILKKNLVIVGTFCYLIGGILPFFYHSSMEVILGCSCIIGVGMGLAMTALVALICEFFEGEERGGMLGLYAVFISVGGTISAMLGGILGSKEWYHAFLAYLILVPILIGEFLMLPQGHLDQDEEGEKQTDRNISGKVWFIAVTGFVFYVCINVINNNASLLVAEKSLGGSVESGYITTCFTVAGIVTGFFIGKIVMRLKRKTIGLGYLLGALGLIIGFVGGSVPVICLGSFISGIGYCIFASTANFHVSELSRPSTLTFSLAFLAALMNLGQALSPIIVNVCSAVVNNTVSIRFAVTAVGIIVIAVIALVTLKNPETVKEAD